MVVCMAFPKSRILSASKFIQVFKESAENKQRFCFILGSGASVDSGIPTGNELEMQWMDELMYKDPSKAKKRGDPTPEVLDEETEKLRKDIRELAEKLYDDDEMTHRFSEIEKAWEDARKEKDGYLSSEYYFDLYKLRFHPNPQNGYRFLEELMQDKEPSLGYRVLSLLLTKARKEEAKKEDREKEWHEALDYAFKTYTPVVIGYGGGDGSLMTYLQQSTSNKGIYWCYLDKYGLPNSVIQKFVRLRNVCLVTIDGFDKFMLELGLTMFPNEIMPPSTSEYLKNQMDIRVKNYTEQYSKTRQMEEVKDILPIINSAEEKYEEDMEKKPELNFWEYFFRADRKYIEGDFSGAIQDYSKAIDLNPNYAFAYFTRCISYAALKQYERAIQDYDKAIELNPNYADAYNNRSNCYLSKHELEKALEDCNKALQLSPNYPEFHHTLASVYLALEQDQNAVDSFTKAIEQFIETNRSAKNLITTYRDRAKAYRALEKFDLAEADEAKAAELEAAEKGNV